MPKKKVVLFIVEGFNDQTALALPLENLLTSDHVICENANLTQKKKSEAAENFRSQYHDDMSGLIKFFHADEISVCNSYIESWEYIKQDKNSLRRCSNFNVYLSPEAIRIQRDFSKLMGTDKEGA